MKKYKFTNNLGLKVMALVFSAFLWLIVVNVDDPVETSTFRNIPVTVKNPEIVTNEGKTYKILDDTQTVSVVVKAKRSVLSKLSANNIVATADMSEMQIDSLIPIRATIPGYEGRYTTEVMPVNLRVKTEDQTKNVFPLTVSASGTPRDGFVVGEMTTNPEKITVRGAESLVNSIDKAVAKVDVSGLSKTTVLQAELIYYDSNGNVVDRSQLKDNLGSDGITVNVQMLNTKSVALNFGVSGIPEEGYIFSGLTCEPDKIQVSGTAEVLEGFEELEIPASEIDITGAAEKLEKTIDILPYLPEGTQLVDETANNIVVTISIEQEGTRTIELSVEAIRVNNLQNNLRVSFDENTDIELQFKGIQEVLDSLDIRNAASIDLKAYTKPGTYEVPVNIETAANITLTKKPTVKVVLTEKDEKTEQEETTENR
ncbi:YbbR-like domain-containing protein [Faecalicatena contorta]|uniref:YbbR domain-containing protein n=1 Tax=Faecalicatena contorta TaxID=39482 RepID=A0A315ZS21_9FIRM|nr:CdaR family protein [Faecalicatena contorta]PWJ48351.1 YbbR domain-containing protein [Faecalicatena contorta]SUQ15374.1 YbbR domain-containing protein [Faecalicatena contorta]